MSFMFSINGQEWEDLEGDYPHRRITDIGSVVEVSAVTFPAYDSTYIDARDKSVLDNARNAVETARSESVETEKRDELELLKLKAIYGGI